MRPTSRSSSTTVRTTPPLACSPPTRSRPRRSRGRARSLADGRVDAVVLNSGGANACTGPGGFADTHAHAPSTSPQLLGIGAGRRRRLLDRPDRRAAPDGPAARRRRRGSAAPSPPTAATPPRSRSRPPTPCTSRPSVDRRRLHRRRHGQGRGHARARPGHDARRPHHRRRRRRARRSTARCAPPRARPSTGSTPTAACRPTTPCCCSRAARRASSPSERGAGRCRARGLRRPRPSADRRRRGCRPRTSGSTSSTRRPRHDAVVVGRAVSRSNLLKCAIHGEDPNWGRVISAAGTTDADVRPARHRRRDQRRVGVPRRRSRGRPRPGRHDRARGRHHRRPARPAQHAATIWTNDLTAMYVHENSAYST